MIMNYSEETRGTFQNMQLGKLALNVRENCQFLNLESPVVLRTLATLKAKQRANFVHVGHLEATEALQATLPALAISANTL